MAKKPLLALDTSVAVHFVLPAPATGQEAEHAAAMRVITELSSQFDFALPAPALGEVLAFMPADKRQVTMDKLTKAFTILALDAEAAVYVGDIARQSLKARSAAKQAVKVDIEVVACCLRWGAAGVCSADADFVKIVGVASAAGRAKPAFMVGPPDRFLPKQEPMPFPDPSLAWVDAIDLADDVEE